MGTNEYNSQPGPVKPTSGQIDEEMALEPIKSATPKKSRQGQNCMRKASTFEDNTPNQLARQGKETQGQTAKRMRMSAGNIKPTKKSSLGVNHQSNSTSNSIPAQAPVKSVQNTS